MHIAVHPIKQRKQSLSLANTLSMISLRCRICVCVCAFMLLIKCTLKYNVFSSIYPNLSHRFLMLTHIIHRSVVAGIDSGWPLLLSRSLYDIVAGEKCTKWSYTTLSLTGWLYDYQLIFYLDYGMLYVQKNDEVQQFCSLPVHLPLHCLQSSHSIRHDMRRIFAKFMCAFNKQLDCHYSWLFERPAFVLPANRIDYKMDNWTHIRILKNKMLRTGADACAEQNHAAVEHAAQRMT